MLAEKFFLLLETLKGRAYPDGSPRVTSSSQHVPMKLPSTREGPTGNDLARRSGAESRRPLLQRGNGTTLDV